MQKRIKNLHTQLLGNHIEEVDGGAERSSRITIDLGIRKHQFSSERILEDELIARLESGINVFDIPLKIYRKHGVYGRQFIIPVGRIDVLAIDKDENLYVIELKKILDIVTHIIKL